MTSFSSFFKYITFLFLVLFLSTSCFNGPYKNNMIATAHPLATAAGDSIFDKGGTAADAAVAAGFALAVVEPSMSGLGGRLQALYRKKDGSIAGIDASTEVPLSYVAPEQRYAYGYETIGIPGVVAGLIALHKAEGKLPLATVMAPAIRLAEKGFNLLPGEALRQQMALEHILKYDGTRFYFTKVDTTAYQGGDLFVQKDLGNVLRRIAKQGHRGFYEGETAQKMVEDIQNNGGILTLEDLKNYKVRPARILEGCYRSHRIQTLYLPSFGAVTIQILQLLDQLDPINKEESDWAATLGKVTQKAYEYRRHQQDEDSLQQMLSVSRAKQMISQMNLDNAIAGELPVEPESWTAAIGHTTHLTASDSYGRIVSLTQTIGPNMGSKVASQGLGFLYAVTLGGYLGDFKPGDRANSHITPTFVSQDDEVILALGAAGGSRIVTAVTQVVQRFIDQKLPLNEALAAPRVYPDKDTLLLENHQGISWDQKVIKDLEERSYPYKMLSQPGRFGRVHAVALDSRKKRWLGAADPDWEGTTSAGKK